MTQSDTMSGRRTSATLRPAVAGDLGDIEALLSANRLPVDDVSAVMENFVVAESRGSLVGAIGLEIYGDQALLRSAVVAEEMRGTGLGSELVNAIVGQATALGVTRVFLLTTTAEKYFPRFGFTRITRDDVPKSVKSSVEFRGACPDSAFVMMRDVPPRAR